MPEYANLTVNAKHKAAQRHRYEDPAAYAVPYVRRIDAKFSLVGALNELLAIIDSETVGRRVRVKKTATGTDAAGSLIRPKASGLTPRGSQTASNNPTAGPSVTITLPATTSFEVGQIVKISSGGYIDYATVTTVNSGVSIVVDLLYYDHTTPTVESEQAYEYELADADGTKPAEWVLAADLDAGEYGWAYDCIEVTGLNTSALSAEEVLLYLSATAGGYTETAPTGADQSVQVVGVLRKKDSTDGRILFFPGNKVLLKFGTSFLQDDAVASEKINEADDFAWSGDQAFIGKFILSGVISPSQITGNQNDYAPTGWADSNVVRLTSDAARNITGFAAGSAGEIKVIHNVGSYVITLKKDDGASTAANQIAAISDIPMTPGSTVVIRYDGTSSRWRPVSVVVHEYSETVNAIGSVGGGSQDIDLLLGTVVTATVDTSTTTFAFVNPPASGRAGSFTLILTNGGSQTVNWPAEVDWEGGVAPTLTASGVDILVFTTVDGGATWYGFVAGLDMQ